MYRFFLSENASTQTLVGPTVWSLLTGTTIINARFLTDCTLF